ncbi:MAG TPA: helix-turn-helix transcriptional regulator [Candidatus Acidoferrum sp.]|nr:helix-turn-helix transcriptional regulator [Candidatus Acidoferrum sp.]
MSPRAIVRSDAKSAKLIREMALKELRRAMGITQEQLARALRINQAGVSKLESRSDIFVGTLRKAIEALGGELEIRARFSTGDVKIKQFGAIVGRSAVRRVSRKRRSKAA